MPLIKARLGNGKTNGKPRGLIAFALANKMARGETFRWPAAA